MRLGTTHPSELPWELLPAAPASPFSNEALQLALPFAGALERPLASLLGSSREGSLLVDGLGPLAASTSASGFWLPTKAPLSAATPPPCLWTNKKP